MCKIHLVIVDGNELTRALMKYVFQESSGVEIVGEAADYKSAVAVLGNVIPDGVLMGDDLPKTQKSALISAIQSDYPGIRVIELAALENAFLRRVNFLPEDSLDQTILTAMIGCSSSGSVH